VSAVSSSDANLGIIGCGNIFERYMRGLARYQNLAVVWCSDVDLALAEARANQFEIPSWGMLDEMLEDDRIDLAINLTPPNVHAATSTSALEAGKHVYTEKPLAATLDEAVALIRTAEKTGRRLASAPDTFLSAAAQMARTIVDSGELGEIIGVSAFITHNRVEEWHPDPTALFKPGGGPVLDLGPYYVTNLVNCLGPVASVSGSARIGARSRLVTAPDRRVDVIEVEVPTHASAVLEFESGTIGTAIMSFDVWERTLPFVEFYGSKGMLSLSDPNTFDGEVRIKLHTDTEWRTVPLDRTEKALEGKLRGIGVADLVASLRGNPHRTGAELAYHVLEVLSSIERSHRERTVIEIESGCERPEPLSYDRL
jgi:predicted dehydrogenase